MKNTRSISLAAALGFTSLVAAAGAAEVKHLQTEKSPIASGVWAGDTLYLSGQLGAASAPGVYGDTNAQSLSALKKIKALLEAQGLGMGDVVMMHAYLAGDPAKGGKMDFAGWNAAYAQFFGIAEQPNKPSRSAMQVAALAAPWALIEVEVIAVRK